MMQLAEEKRSGLPLNQKENNLRILGLKTIGISSLYFLLMSLEELDLKSQNYSKKSIDGSLMLFLLLILSGI